MRRNIISNNKLYNETLENRKKDLDIILTTMSSETTKLLNADRCTIYVYDWIKDELWSKIAQGLEIDEIRLKIGQGIAGYVAQTKKILNIKDAYDTPYFNPEIDKATGYITKTLLVSPLLNNLNEIIGVIEVLNKKDGVFTEKDALLITTLSNICAISIEQAQLYQWNSMLRQYNENIIQNISSGLIVTDKDFKITLSNPVAKKIFSHFSIKLQNKTIEDIIKLFNIPPGFFKKLDKKDIAHIDKINVKFKGLTMYFNLNASKLVADKEENYGYILLFDDITEQVLLEIETKQKEASSMIGKMASSIIHDIKNPIAIIKAYAQLIDRKVNQDDVDKSQIKNYYNIIDSEVNRIVHMTEEILKFVQGEYEVNTTKCNVEEFINEIKYQIKELLHEKEIKLNIELLYKGNINIDKYKLQRLFYNITDNAYGAIKEKGTLDIYIKKQNKYLKIHFKDNGKGMPPKIIKDIFIPFTSYDKQKGIGLGMAIVKKIVDEHEGNISIKSKENEGTEVIVSIPFGLENMQNYSKRKTNALS